MGARWAIVIGIDEYGDPTMRLSAAVSDAQKFHQWVIAPDGGGVPVANTRLLLGRRADNPGGVEGEIAATKDSIVTAFHDVVT